MTIGPFPSLEVGDFRNAKLHVYVPPSAAFLGTCSNAPTGTSRFVFMPDPIEPDEGLDPLILDLGRPNSKFIVRHNRAEINQLAANLSAVAANLNQNLLGGLNLHLPKINAAIAASIPPLPRMPLMDSVTQPR